MSKTKLVNKIRPLESSVEDTEHKEMKGLAKFPSENPNPVIRVLNDGNILYYNKASTFLLNFWGCQTTKILPDNYIKIVSDVLHSGLNSVAEVECKDRVILLTFAPIIEEGYVNIYGIDITERKKAEEDIKTINESLEKLVFERTKELEENNVKLIKEINEHKKTEEESRRSKLLLEAFVENTPSVIFIKDLKGRFIRINRAFEDLFGINRKDFLGKKDYDLYPTSKITAERMRANDRMVLEAGKPLIIEEAPKVQGENRFYTTVKFPIHDEQGEIASIAGIATDITERIKTENMLQEQKKALEQKNIALNEILGQLAIEKKQIKDNVIANAENLLLPIIEKIGLKGESGKYAQLLRENVQELTSSLGARLSDRKLRLTSREIDICNMIKNGLTSKEIAGLLNISLLTIEKHRFHIRKKLGIVNEKLNLSSVLKTL
ncbi:MAG: PAS domain-containing protein [Candidatus Scalindua sp.]